jgi:hypothetical protein
MPFARKGADQFSSLLDQAFRVSMSLLYSRRITPHAFLIPQLSNITAMIWVMSA